MIKAFHLKVPLILQSDCYQDTNVRCGAACAQMVLHDIDPARPLTKHEQQHIYDRIIHLSPDTSVWHNPPQSITCVLNECPPEHRRPDRGFGSLPPHLKAIFSSIGEDPATTYEFAILGDSRPVNDPGLPRAIDPNNQIEQIELLTRLLVRMIAIKGVPPIIAVREDNAHWVVVNGFQLEGRFGDDHPNRDYRIQAMMIRNPLGRYTYNTVTCGSIPGRQFEQITGHCCKMNPYVQDVVAYDTWVREYLFNDWSASFVAICDRSPRTTDDLVEEIKSYRDQDSDQDQDSESRAFRRRAHDGESQELRVTVRLCQPEHEITAEEAKDRAASAIEEFDLSRLNRNVTPERLMDPVKVARLDRLDGGHYLVPAGVENRIFGLITISATGEFNEATILPRGHYTVPFDQRPDFRELIDESGGCLRGRRVRVPGYEHPLTITGLVRNEQIPYVWRPTPESFSPSRPFHNLKLTVEGTTLQIPFHLPVDNFCLSKEDDQTGVITLPTASYLELLTSCIKQGAQSITSDLLVLISRTGSTLLVMYRTSQSGGRVKKEVDEMRKIICHCLNAAPRAGLNQFRIRAYDTNDFMTKWRGGGEDGPVESAPQSGTGGGYSLNTCAQWRSDQAD